MEGGARHKHLALCFLTLDAMWPAISSFCRCAFPTAKDWSEAVSQNNPSSPRVVRAFYHSIGKEILALSSGTFMSPGHRILGEMLGGISTWQELREEFELRC